MKTESKKLLAIYLTLVAMSFAFLSITPKASAADIKYVPLAPIEGTFDTATGATNLGTYLVGMFKVGVAAAGALAFLMIVWGGFTYLSTDAITGKEEGKERITRALGGLVLALAAYIILNTIGGSSLVNLNLDFGLAAQPGTVIGTPSDLENQQTIDNMIAEGHKKITDTQATAQGLEAQVKTYQDELDTIEYDPVNPDPVAEARAAALEQLIIDTSKAATAVRAYGTYSQNITAALANGKAEVSPSRWASVDKQAEYLQKYTDSITYNFNKAQGELLAVGRTAEVVKLNDQRKAALSELCKSTSEAAQEKVAYCHNLLLNPGN